MSPASRQISSRSSSRSRDSTNCRCRNTPNLQDYYIPTELTSKDYPNLLQPGETVDTIAVPQVLAVYNWPPETDRYRRARFVEYFFKRFDQFKQPPFHPKWNEVNLASQLRSWTRFQAAEELLAATRLPASDNLTKQQFDEWVKNSGRQLNDDETKQLFEEFHNWIKQRKNPPGE
jgi:hypothetical protein